jgi:hypothetical protein
MQEAFGFAEHSVVGDHPSVAVVFLHWIRSHGGCFENLDAFFYEGEMGKSKVAVSHFFKKVPTFCLRLDWLFSG